MLFTKVTSLAIFVGSAVAQLNATRLEDGGASVDAKTKASWCIGQRSACDTLCNKSALVNDCKSDLTWNCQCGDGETPEDLAEYKDTIPFFICQTSFAKCIEANPDDALGQTNCKENIEQKCATKDIANYTAAETTTSSSAASNTASLTTTTSAGSEETGAADAAATTSAAAAAATTTEAAGNGASALQGSIVLVAGALAAFGLML